MTVPSISLICHSFLPKIEIHLKYFLDKNFQKQPLWEKSEGSSWSQRASPRKATLRQETKASFVASKAASAEMKEKALVSTMSLSVQNLPIIVQKLSKKIQRKSINSKTFKIYPKFFLKTELREMKEKALVSTMSLSVQNRPKTFQKISKPLTTNLKFFLKQN